MNRFNKATAAALSGAAVAILASLFELTPELQGGLATLLTAGLVWLVPNK